MLSELEKMDLRQMLCSGAFGMKNQNGLNLTPDGLKELGSKPDDEIRAMIKIWKSEKISSIQKHIKNLQSQIDILTVDK